MRGAPEEGQTSPGCWGTSGVSLPPPQADSRLPTWARLPLLWGFCHTHPHEPVQKCVCWKCGMHAELGERA